MNSFLDDIIPVTQNPNQISINAESAWVDLNVNEPLIEATLVDTPLIDELLLDKFMDEVPLACKPSSAELLLEKPVKEVSLVDEPFLAEIGQLNAGKYLLVYS